MDLKRVTETPQRYTGYESTELEERDVKHFASLGLQKAWYWYGTQPYEGAGVLIGFKDGKYCMKDIGHCSCYGPTGIGVSSGDDWAPDRWHDSLDNLLGNVSSDYERASVGPVVEFARANP